MYDDIDGATLLLDLGDWYTSIPETDGLAGVDWDKDFPQIVWSENMGYHATRLLPNERFKFGLAEAAAFELNVMLGEDWNVSAEWEDKDDDDTDKWPQLTFTVTRVKPMPIYITVAGAYDLLWPAIATLFNVTDPGTWNSPYLFAKLIERN